MAREGGQHDKDNILQTLRKFRLRADSTTPHQTPRLRRVCGNLAAHKLETLTRYHLRHGEAVAIGLALDTRYSVLCGLLPEGDDERVCFLLEHLGFKLWHAGLETKSPDGQSEILRGLVEFREHLGGALTITLLEKLGCGIEVHKMDDELVSQSIQWLKKRHA